MVRHSYSFTHNVDDIFIFVEFNFATVFRFRWAHILSNCWRYFVGTVMKLQGDFLCSHIECSNVNVFVRLFCAIPTEMFNNFLQQKNEIGHFIRRSFFMHFPTYIKISIEFIQREISIAQVPEAKKIIKCKCRTNGNCMENKITHFSGPRNVRANILDAFPASSNRLGENSCDIRIFLVALVQYFSCTLHRWRN